MYKLVAKMYKVVAKSSLISIKINFKMYKVVAKTSLNSNRIFCEYFFKILGFFREIFPSRESVNRGKNQISIRNVFTIREKIHVLETKIVKRKKSY